MDNSLCLKNYLISLMLKNLKSIGFLKKPFLIFLININFTNVQRFSFN